MHCADPVATGEGGHLGCSQLGWWVDALQSWWSGLGLVGWYSWAGCMTSCRARCPCSGLRHILAWIVAQEGFCALTASTLGPKIGLLAG